MIKKKDKIIEFFTFEKYFRRRMHNLDKDYLEYIKDMAFKNEAYEFLDALKDN